MGYYGSVSIKIKELVKDILRELGPYVKVADWNKKESIRAKIRMVVKGYLIRKLSAGISYKEIDSIASEMLGQ